MRRLAKPVLFLAALTPTAWLLWGLFEGDLGANPAETIQLQTGRWAFKFLLVTLAITPLRRLTKWNVLIQYRRMLGLFAFYYASLHFTSYIVLDKYFDWEAMLLDVGKRP
ncbi:MAG TPA: ferric reductase-like transmembrane domain-containing protein, partial [Vicinamibacterales bacterium]